MNLSLCREENIGKDFPRKVEGYGDNWNEKHGQPSDRSCPHYMRSNSNHIEIFAGASSYSDFVIDEQKHEIEKNGAVCYSNPCVAETTKEFVRRAFFPNKGWPSSMDQRS
mmetsp:Transcript_92360/g.138268  ORF Transcript_92360/g.138268 Transcript_92360/m.138268 type:complete len:110 (-) Transcript_92360:1393-1722(-)